MKTSLTCLAAAITICAQLTLPAYADSGILTRPKGKARSSDSAAQGNVIGKEIIVAPGSASSAPAGRVQDREIMVDPSTRNAQRSRVKEMNFASRPFIKEFTARREGGAIMISATMSLAANVPDELVNYEIMHLVNGRWTVVTSGGTGRLTIPSGGVRQVFAQLNPTVETVRLRMDVHGFESDRPYAYSSKQITLKGRNVEFVVRYGTSGDWVVARNYLNDLSNGFDASEFARTRLNPLGLDTRIQKTRTGGVDTWFSNGSSMRTVLLVRTASQLEMTFGSREEAEQFRQTLISLVQDRRLTVESVRER